MKDSKKKTMILTGVAVVTLALFVVGATYAYFTAQGGDPAAAKINVTTYTTDVLTFATGDDINIYADQESFASGKGNATGSTYAKALLTANNKTNTATEHYYVYLNITKNEFIYTINKGTPELILSITDADGNEVTNIGGLKYVSVTDGKGETVSGFDITESYGLLTLINNREITATPKKEDQWNIKLTLVNYDKDQTKNAGKNLNAKVVIQKQNVSDITIKTNSLPTAYGKLGAITCSNSETAYNQKYNRIEVSNINTKYENCTLNYKDDTSKVNLASYITNLAGTTQGTGQVVNEVANIPDYSSTFTIAQSAYTSQSVFSSTSSSSTSGTAVSGAYTFASNTWTSDPSAMTSNTYYHFKFNPSENGYYQMCYDLSAGNSGNYLFAFVNTTRKYFEGSSYLSASTTDAKSGCVELGYVSTSDYIKVTQKAYTDISTLSFSIKKVTTINSVTDIRYEGKNPNNYVWFNNEYWRIIGVFDSGSHGQNGKNLVKIIREDHIGGITWNNSRSTDWPTAGLNLLLNGAYYNAQDGTFSGYCDGSGILDNPGITANCDYTKKGIQSGYRNMIANVTWYLGGASSPLATTEEFYGYERGTNVYSGNSTTSKGYIGLMYASDYGYSVLSSSCARTTSLRDYDTASCAGQSWMFGKQDWTLTPYSPSSLMVFVILNDGAVYELGAVRVGYTARPVLYLESSVYKMDGDGSLENPYIIGM